MIVRAIEKAAANTKSKAARNTTGETKSFDKDKYKDKYVQSLLFNEGSNLIGKKKK